MMLMSTSSVVGCLVFCVLLSACRATDHDTLTAVQSVVQEQGDVLRTLQAEMTAAKNTIQQQGDLINRLQTRLDKRVAFAASFLSKQSVNLGVHGIIKFSNVLTNIGGGYNSATGIFTAPFSGTYDFTLHIRGDNAHGYVFVVLMVNDNFRICEAVAEGSTSVYYDKCSCSGAVHLNAGDQVFARHNDGSTYIEYYTLTSLTGFLISAD